jgi:hypothetical protein
LKKTEKAKEKKKTEKAKEKKKTEKAKEKKEEEKTEKWHAAVLGLRRHTLEGVMIDFEKISKPLEHLKPKRKRKKRKNGEQK